MGRNRSGIALALAAALAAGCATTPELAPAPGARPAPPGPGKGAEATVAGVTVVARSDAWSGFPRDLNKVTPMLVTIENNSKTPLRIRYNEFKLVAPNGKSYSAIPPFNIHATQVEPITDVGYTGFWVAPYYAPYYPHLRAYPGAFPFDEFYYNTYYPAFVDVNLPTGDMIQKALPEGVLDTGGRVTGFLYFQNVGKKAGTVNFTQQLVNARSGANFGTVRIPFQVD
jgi:hypothetical protein